jgi:putative transposase
VLAGVPYHITQRGVDRRETFSSDADRATYLRLLRENLEEAEAAILGWCLMPNHVHLVAMPAREDSLGLLLRRVHGRYAQYYNARTGRSGHLWQNRFFSCALGPGHLWAALAYVERNPVLAGLAMRAGDYRWSSAGAHLSGGDPAGVLDLDWWRRENPEDWEWRLEGGDRETDADLRSCTHAGRPFGSDDFVAEMAEQFGRRWVRGRPPRVAVPA